MRTFWKVLALSLLVASLLLGIFAASPKAERDTAPGLASQNAARIGVAAAPTAASAAAPIGAATPAAPPHAGTTGAGSSAADAGPTAALGAPEKAPPLGGTTGEAYGRAAGGLPAAPPLTAGQIDDNARFSEYLDYLSNYRGPQANPIPVDWRIFVRVTDANQRPVAGAQVQIFDGDRSVFTGQTVSDGRVLFLPATAGIARDQGRPFRAVVTRGQQRATGTVPPRAAEQTIALPKLTDSNGPVGLDLVFLLDATGSMGDEIDKIKSSVDSIASRIEQIPGSSKPRFGLVVFRDRGDAFITHSWDFTSDARQFQANLAPVEAGGGGDNPESVNAGLHDAINLPGWADNSTGRHLRMIILVGDAPPHLDYANDYSYPDLLQQAAAAGIKICPIGASGLEDQGEYIFRQFAQVTQGQFIFLTYANGVSGAPGPATDHHVSNYTVQDLDGLVVGLVAGEIANQTGSKPGASAPSPVGAQVNPADPSTPASPSDNAAAALGSLRDRALNLLTGGQVPLWLLLLVPALFFAARLTPARARRAASPSVSFASPPARHSARFTPDHTTALPSAMPSDRPRTSIFITHRPADHPTMPLD